MNIFTFIIIKQNKQIWIFYTFEFLLLLAQVRKTQLAIQRYIPEKAVFKFFDTRKCTPDLTQLFHGIDRNKLKRTSSAIWKTPPRYSMMETEWKV